LREQRSYGVRYRRRLCWRSWISGLPYKKVTESCLLKPITIIALKKPMQLVRKTALSSSERAVFYDRAEFARIR
jgi:hypothetical protein